LLTYLKDILKIVLFFGVGFTILYFVYTSQNVAFQEQCALDGIPPESCSLINKVWTDLLSVKWIWLLIVLLCFNISNLSRALRWKMMLQSLNYQIRTPNAFFCIMLSYFANLGLPRAGEVVRATVFSRYEKIRIEKLLGTIVLDRMLDMVSVLFIFLLAILLEFELIWGFISENLGTSNGGFPIWLWWF
jgi:glycosyltransferase 2 family protein